MRIKIKRTSVIVKTLSGLENILEDEIRSLGFKETSIVTRGVELSANDFDIIKLNLCLRTALRVLKNLSTFYVDNRDQVYKNIFAIEWEKYFDVNKTISIQSNIHQSNIFKNSMYLSQLVKDAVVDRFRKAYSTRPNIDSKKPDILIDVHLNKNEFVISLDSTGDSLHKRGYKVDQGRAPLSEVLSAGIIRLSGWDNSRTLLDPMCGSGTNLTEAALMAKGIFPAYFRENFCFKNWKSFDENLYKETRAELISQIIECDINAIGLDIEAKAINSSRKNLLRINSKVKSLTKVDFFEYSPDNQENILIINPPYGERLRQDNINLFYKNIGDNLKQHFTGSEAWIISSNEEALKKIGLRTSRKITVYNGALKCKLHKYELYKGTKKHKTN